MCDTTEFVRFFMNHPLKQAGLDRFSLFSNLVKKPVYKVQILAHDRDMFFKLAATLRGKWNF